MWHNTKNVTSHNTALCSPHNITIRVKFITGAQWRLPLNINTSPRSPSTIFTVDSCSILCPAYLRPFSIADTIIHHFFSSHILFKASRAHKSWNKDPLSSVTRNLSAQTNYAYTTTVHSFCLWCQLIMLLKINWVWRALWSSSGLWGGIRAEASQPRMSGRHPRTVNIVTITFHLRDERDTFLIMSHWEEIITQIFPGAHTITHPPVQTERILKVTRMY